MSIFTPGVGSMDSAVKSTITFEPDLGVEVLLTRMSVDSGANVQFDSTFNSDVYVTVFGDKLSTATFTGLELATRSDPPCGEAGVPGGLLAYYKTNKVSSSPSELKMVKITYNDQVFSGVLTALSGQTESRPGYIMFMFTLNASGRFL